MINKTTNIGKYVVEVTRIEGENIKKFINKYYDENIVKLIFYKEGFGEDISWAEIKDLHQVKHLFSAKKYVRLPLKFVCENNSENYNSVVITEGENDCDGFVVVAKTDAWDTFKKARYKAKERNEQTEELCRNEVEVLNSILNGYAFQIVYSEDNTIKGVTYAVSDGTDTEESIMESIKEEVTEDYITENYG